MYYALCLPWHQADSSPGPLSPSQGFDKKKLGYNFLRFYVGENNWTSQIHVWENKFWYILFHSVMYVFVCRKERFEELQEYLKGLPCKNARTQKSGADILEEDMIKTLEAEVAKVVVSHVNLSMCFVIFFMQVSKLQLINMVLVIARAIRTIAQQNIWSTNYTHIETTPRLRQSIEKMTKWWTDTFIMFILFCYRSWLHLSHITIISGMISHRLLC